MIAPNWNQLTPDERFEARMAAWMAEEISFVSPQVAETHRRRAQRLKDAITLKKPDRVPIRASIANYLAEFAGMTAYDLMYDSGKYREARIRFHEEFDPDYLVYAGAASPGRVFDILDYKLYRWAGHGIPKESPLQALELELMGPDDYDRLIADPESYCLRSWMPKAFGVLEGLQLLPSFFTTMEFPGVPGFATPVGTPDVQKALKALLEAGTAALEWAGAVGQADAHIVSTFGAPAVREGFSKAPFDIIGDTFRGTRALSLDLFRRPAKVIEAMERIVPIAVDLGVRSANARRSPLVFMPLHKGADGFISSKDFEKFYWPTLKAVILGLINEGLVPSLFAEGGYNQRLDVIVDPDIPAGRTCWLFDRTDMVKVKERLGGWACFAGNVPGAMMNIGTPEEVSDCVKKLLDTVAGDGGYILSLGASIDRAKAENVHAMFNTCREYGVYR
ncbi:MAG: uroporphyrinogen decarboxylase [Deltaproteobacteria bacterium]|nr:uroporphyrinogen decarboxylase [Deltaproteobacteria bacterium]